METDLIAATSLGALRGQRERGAILFRGVPYAAAARFGAPGPAQHWAGERDATKNGPISPQSPSRLAAAMGGFERPQGEDSLSLTIATPSITGRRPVLVFIHGGAFMTGAGSLAWYDGGRLAAEGDIVVVCLNYRLGALGFLRGDLGLDDQEAALRFIAAEIASFGGDPAAITLAGQSAGATSIASLLPRPGIRALVKGAILMSGPFGRAFREAKPRVAVARRFRELLEDDPATAPLPAMLTAQGRLARELARVGDATPPFWPTPPGGEDFLPTVARAADGLPVMIGATREEFHVFYRADPGVAALSADAAAALAERLGGSLDAARAARPDGEVVDWLADLATEAEFVGPARHFAGILAAAGAVVFPYRFDAAPSPVWRACHCIELPFFFGNREAWREAPMMGGLDEAAFDRISAPVRASVIRFVREGNPGWAAGDMRVLGKEATAS